MEIPKKNRSILDLKKNKTVYFIHTPKCGGKFVEKIFSPYIKDCHTMKEWASGHLTFQEYKKKFKEHGIDFTNSYIFSVVRNPWEWHVSWFHYLKEDIGGIKSGHVIESEIFQKFSFEDYLSWLDDESLPRSKQGYIQKQVSDWVVDDQGSIAVDNIIKSENLIEGIREMVESLNIKVDIKNELYNHRENKSVHKNFRTYYKQKDVDLIEKRHSRDIKLFGYSFE